MTKEMKESKKGFRSAQFLIEVIISPEDATTFVMRNPQGQPINVSYDMFGVKNFIENAISLSNKDEK